MLFCSSTNLSEIGAGGGEGERKDRRGENSQLDDVASKRVETTYLPIRMREKNG
jgi:hypothetical protein